MALADELLEAVRKSFTNSSQADNIVSGIERELRKKGVSYKEAEEYAARLGELLAAALKENLTAETLPGGILTEELAEAILRPLLYENYEAAAQVAARVQTSLNRNAGLGMKGLQAEVNTVRLDGLVEKASSCESFEKAARMLDEPVVNFTQSAVEDTIRKNTEAHFKAGLSPKIKRIATGNACKWCRGLAGNYDYPVEREVYRRHKYCRCLVLYDPGDGKIQNVHTKAMHDSMREAEREGAKAVIEKRLKLQHEKEEREKHARSIATHPENLSLRSPGEWKKDMEKRGFTVKPLKAGSLKNIPFESGGGWKVNFDDGGIIQYHPEDKSHHQGAYYKISTGTTGTHHYNLKGGEIDVEASEKAGRQILKNL